MNKLKLTLELEYIIYPLRSFLKLNLDILSFDNQCHTINQILSENKLFLRVFELKDKFRYITENSHEKKK